MRHVLAIIRRDLEEKRFIFATALVFAVLPFVAIAIPGFRADARSSVATAANIIAVNFVLAVAIGLGATMIGSDLSAGRLSFYFSKPISSRALWYGKLLSALLMIYGSLAIVAIPASIYAINVRGGEWVENRVLIAALVIIEPALLLVTHAISTMLRARSAILIADAAAITVAIGAGWLIARPLVDALAVRLLLVAGVSVAVALLISLVLAGSWQIGRARSDRRANHVELSKFLWSAVGAILLMAAIFVGWVVSVRPADLKEASLYGAPEGPWVLAGGRVPHRMDYRAAFLVNSTSGRFFRIPWRDVDFNAFTFSRRGNAVAWTHVLEGRDRRGEIWTNRLDPLGSVLKTGIVASPWQQIVLSDDGARLAYAGAGLLGVADAATGRSLGSARLDIDASPSDVSLFFVNPDVIRVYVAPPPASEKGPRDLIVRMWEFDVRQRSIRKTGELRVAGRFLSFGATPDGSRLIVRTASPANPQDTAFVADARTGARIATLPTDVALQRAAPLPDGTIAAAVMRERRVHFRRFASNGELLADIDLGPAAWAYIAGLHGSRLLVVIEEREHADRWTGWKSVVVDLAHNGVERAVPDVRPAKREHPYEDDPRVMLPAGPIFAALDNRGRIVCLDIRTGAVTPLEE